MKNIVMDESVAFVHEGKIFAKEAGSAVIEVRTGEHVARCEVTVEVNQEVLQLEEATEEFIETEDLSIKEDIKND